MKLKYKAIMLKYSRKIIGVLLFMLITGCNRDRNLLERGTFVTIEDAESKFSTENYGYLSIGKDTIILNSYGPSYNDKLDKRLFIWKKENTFQNPIDNEIIITEQVNDSIIEVNFEDDFNQRYVKIDSKKKAVDFDFRKKKFLYNIEGNTYTMEFYDDYSAIGINLISKDSVRFKWMKTKLANQWFIIMSNKLYSYHLKIDSVMGDEEVFLSRYLEKVETLKFTRLDRDSVMQ